jgi:DNA polymerase (family 10)
VASVHASQAPEHPLVDEIGPYVYARGADETGVALVIDSDAHGSETLRTIRYRVATARRPWLTPEQMASMRPWPELDRLPERSHKG